MKKMMGMFYVILVLVSIVGFSASSYAYTAQEIANSVIAELDNVSDYTADVDCDYSPTSMTDITNGSIQSKRNSGNWKVKMILGSPYTSYQISDGTGWNFMSDPSNGYYVPYNHGYEMIHRHTGTNMFNMEKILDDETWAKDPNTATVNNVPCYRIYTTNTDKNNYELWIDEATRTKVIRVKVTDVDKDLQWKLDYSDYSNVENTSQLPATITTTRYISGTFWYSATYSFSNIDINENLPNSIFTLELLN